MELNVLSFNIHKFHSPVQGRYMLQALKDELKLADLDIVFLQELKGVHPKKHQGSYLSDPLEHLADEVWDHYAYGRNSVYPSGHHGNAILSKFPVIDFTNYDVSNHSLERRGILHAKIEIPNLFKVNLFCTHFDLTNWGRKKQALKLISLLESIPADEPIILAGDFNDWNSVIHKIMVTKTALKPTPLFRTFPSFLPLLHLDKVYFRGLEHLGASVLNEKKWRRLSDHLPLLNTFKLRLPS